MDVPNDISSLFELLDLVTRETVIGRDIYITTKQDFLNLD